MTDSEKKQKLRKEMLKKRAALTEAEIAEAERLSLPKILEFIKSISEKKGRPLTVMSYMSFKNEFPTHRLNEKISSAGHRLVLPYTDREFVITACLTEGSESLTVSRLGVPEPDPDVCRHMKADDMDIILMPGVAFDSAGNRAGFGKGCYDRFLAEAGKLPVLAALAYDFQVTDAVPAEERDIPCMYIITERGITECIR